MSQSDLACTVWNREGNQIHFETFYISNLIEIIICKYINTKA